MFGKENDPNSEIKIAPKGLLSKFHLPHRRKFGLAFGGGAARGLAHIGVIRYLEEYGFKANEAAGTSMGAIIAALYAFGKSSEEMEKITGEINYFKLLDVDLKRGIIRGEKVKDHLVSIFGNTRIEDLDIPLKIVSADILTGDKVIYESGSIADALRASISIPGIVMPYIYDGHELVDGGIMNNLPIELLENDNVLAVSVLRDVTRSIESTKKVFGFQVSQTIFGLSYQILQKSIDIMMKQNEDRSLSSGKNTILIYPKFPGIDYYEFHKYQDIIRIGYETASNADLKKKIYSLF